MDLEDKLLIEEVSKINKNGDLKEILSYIKENQLINLNSPLHKNLTQDQKIKNKAYDIYFRFLLDYLSESEKDKNITHDIRIILKDKSRSPDLFLNDKIINLSKFIRENGSESQDYFRAFLLKLRRKNQIKKKNIMKKTSTLKNFLNNVSISLMGVTGLNFLYCRFISSVKPHSPFMLFEFLGGLMGFYISRAFQNDFEVNLRLKCEWSEAMQTQFKKLENELLVNLKKYEDKYLSLQSQAQEQLEQPSKPIIYSQASTSSLIANPISNFELLDRGNNEQQNAANILKNANSPVVDDGWTIVTRKKKKTRI